MKPPNPKTDATSAPKSTPPDSGRVRNRDDDDTYTGLFDPPGNPVPNSTDCWWISDKLDDPCR